MGKFSTFGIFFLCAVLLVCAGCSNRAGVRIPGASLPFPETSTKYKAKKSFPYAVVVTMPVDQRPQFYGKQVAGTQWTGCSTDALWSKDAPMLVQERLVEELKASNLFSTASTMPSGADEVVLKTEIHAFCSQAVGVLFLRVAGICAMKISLEQNGKVLIDKKFEKVVTDEDKEYTGSQVSTIEQAMVRTISDSLRELMKEMLTQIEAQPTR